MANEKKVSILGCGWLGLPVAEKLLTSGYEVNGSTTTPTKLTLLADKGIKPFLIDLAAASTLENLPTFLNSQYLMVSFPPGLRAGNGENYRQQIEILGQAIAVSPVQNILFISSTAVYPDVNRVVTEAEELETYQAHNILLQAEALLRQFSGKSTTIVRMAGLVGGARQAGRFLAGKQNIPNPEAPVNLIHLNDCIGLVTAIFKQEKWGEIYNGCADEHPTRKDFYTAAAQKLNLPLPHFAPVSPADGFKIISNQKIKKDLGYRFNYPDPMFFI
ncbi:NAD(P)-dependent oxidoreductase [Adhaeribacter aerolatus]|uniref:NAD(P)-dependent oxidoreductase n=1 Tax=Adhaeribacter aerolatus TaxID=670289 RepID=A0A512B4P5_9BACT|nr:SDR family oxidoreductase [Adhaeribacter aerolatus]GEO06930.1 NAD(P)-dependent oxidoreductase [Adhaeribacter aerolatus]